MPPKDTKKKQVEEIVVSGQQSRFHVDASDAPISKEIDIKDLTLTIGGRDLLTHANLTLLENRHYVLVGRNGTGKSTILRALAEGRIPGVPWNLYILLLGQTDFVNSYSALDDKLTALSLNDGTVLDHVVRSDATRERALLEAKHLSEALDDVKDPVAVVRAIRKLNHERLLWKHGALAKIAARRSGARGARARKELITIEDQVAASELLLHQPANEIDPVTVEAETRAAVDMLADVQSSLGAMDSASAEARARTVLLGLGFSAEAIARPFTMLSGGWRTRCSLACALFQKVDILLLVECTNFLDLPAIIWLEGFVQSLVDTTVVIITHDHDFADAVADELLVLRERGLEHFKGNLSDYEHERYSRAKYLTRMQAAQDKKTKHMESSIAHALTAAKRTGDDKKLKQVASRRKKIEERSGVEVGVKGGRFKLNRDLMGYHNTMRDAIDIPIPDPLIKITFPYEPPDLRFPGALVSLEKVTFCYPGAKLPTLKEVDLVIHPGERVGISGLNGSGKSTLVSLVVGNNGGTAGLGPTTGTVTRHARAKIQCFSQHAVETLERKGASNGKLTALQEMLDITEGAMTQQEVRGLLGGLGLHGREASDIPIAALSGGQKVRLALAKLVYSAPHLLVLDEVTTHLDSDTVIGLVEALRQFQGALLSVTHDRFFMRSVIEGRGKNEEGEEEEEGKKWEATLFCYYTMTPIRLRYPKGVTTIQVRDDFTVQDLQQEIYAASDILPSRQSLKAGYPPKVLTIVPELPITSLGLNPGEQIIVSELQVPAAPSARSAPVTQSSLPSRNDLLHTRPSPAYTPSAPASIPPASAPPGLDYVDTDGGVLIHRIVPDDNSCLFSAVALIFKQDISKAPEMRKIVAQGIRNDPETYTEAILGMPPSRYTAKILNPSTWGGAIELGILASHFRTEIASIDVETGRIDHFSPQDALGTRCILIYSGIHYDAATLAPMLDAPSEWHQTMFPVQSSSGDDPVLVAAKKLADILRGKKAYTNTSIFDLKCEECGQGLKGEKGARAHAEQTGHVRFGEH